MKRIIALWLAALLLLCGCAADPDRSPTDASSDPTTPVEPSGFYNPDSAAEAATGGAIQVYDLGHTGYYAMAPMGKDALLFSGTNHTTLTKVTGDNLYAVEAVNLSCYISPSQAAVGISDKGVTYFDPDSREVVFLDVSLKEVSRIALPADSAWEPALSADRKTLYYCTTDGLRVIDLDSGMDKLLKEMDFSKAELLGLHCSGTVLECAIVDEHGDREQLFLSTQTGETLANPLAWASLATTDSTWFAVTMDGIYQRLLIGSTEGETKALTPVDEGYAAFPVLEMNGVVTAAPQEAGTTLSFYDTASGNRTAMVALEGSLEFRSVWGDRENSCVWLMLSDPKTGNDTIYRWNIAQTPCDEGVSCLGPVYTREAPDAAGMAACEATAQQIGQDYGVEILIGEAAVQVVPADYRLMSEYQIPVLEDSLQMLEAALARFGSSIVSDTAESTSSGALRICLVRSLEGDMSTGYVNDPFGVQFRGSDGNVYIILAVGETLEQSFCHQFFHVVETRVMSTCSAYDNWNKLNPAGFEYDNNYALNLQRTDATYLEGEQRAFIDFHSMSFPTEDRARIMEYAMADGQADCFQSETMQAKLRQLCLGIREAYGLKKSTETYPWEQYLTESLAYQGKK
ncbi:MAG: hypothetical protein IJX69_06605 [Oscillospiraceae bacterium]|nr:hypothetical protein [Oscillospiraceae bacterium]